METGSPKELDGIADTLTFKRLMACIVVPLPAKKSTIKALGLDAVTNLIVSCTAYIDFGKSNFPLPMIEFRNVVP